MSLRSKRMIYWPTFLFFIITPLLAAIALPLYLAFEGVPVPILAFSLVFAALTNLSITAGYHRLWAHKSYEVHPGVKFILLLISASAWQGSALKWSSDHRKHHAKVDSDEDPYSIKEGFWHAHMGWLFWKETVDLPVHAPDLEKDPLLAWQHRYYVPLAIFMSFGVPTFFGLLYGAPWAGFLFGGVVRVLLTQQSTFFVNSLSHTLGKQTYCGEVSARDSILVAILTHGEGYHNFHHRFQADYRNGIRWYHWDPTKWTIWGLSKVGLAKRLRKVSDVEILKARLMVDSLKLKAKGHSDQVLAQWRERILARQTQVVQLKKEMLRYRQEASDWSHDKLMMMKGQLREARDQFKADMGQWRRMLTQSALKNFPV